MSEGHWTDRLSEYLDGELGPEERAAAERHLAGCPDCAGVLEELRAVVAEARTLPDAAPARDLWPGIQARLAPRAEAGTDVTAGAARAGGLGEAGRSRGRPIPLAWRRRLVVSVPQLLAAGIAVAVLSAGAVWMVLGGSVGPAGPAGAGLASGAVAPAPSDVMLAAYEPAMVTLESEYERRRDELDPETIRVVEKNLAIIDAAIEEARRALAEDPSSGYLQGHLADAVRQRMSLLRQVASI
jgi:anti-sigma factor RsiW